MRERHQIGFERLERLRKSRGISVSDMADALGISTEQCSLLRASPGEPLSSELKASIAREILAARLILQGAAEGNATASSPDSGMDEIQAVRARILQVKKRSGLSNYSLSLALDVSGDVIDRVVYGGRLDGSEFCEEVFFRLLNELELAYPEKRRRLR